MRCLICQRPALAPAALLRPGKRVQLRPISAEPAAEFLGTRFHSKRPEGRSEEVA